MTKGSAESIMPQDPIWWGLPEIGWVAIAAVAAVIAVLIPLIMRFFKWLIPSQERQPQLIRDPIETPPAGEVIPTLEIQTMGFSWLNQRTEEKLEKFKVSVTFVNRSDHTLYVTELHVDLNNTPKLFKSLNITVLAHEQGVCFETIEIPTISKPTFGHAQLLYRSAKSTSGSHRVRVPFAATVKMHQTVMGPSFSYDVVPEVSRQSLDF